MQHFLFKLTCLTSLAICLGMTALSARSYVIEDGCYVARGWYWFSFASFRGEVGCEFGRSYDGGPQDSYANCLTFGVWQRAAPQVPPSDHVHIAEFATMPHYHDVYGFRWHPRLSSDMGQQRARGIAVPAWSLILIAGWLPFRAMTSRRRGTAWRSAGFCPTCGYDLRASPDRCPECGASVAASPAG